MSDRKHSITGTSRNLMNHPRSSLIRKFRIEDIDKIAEIEEEAFPKTAYPRECFLRFARSLPDTFVVIEAGKDVLGYIVFDMHGHIITMAVKAEFRRKGLGTALFTHAARCAQKRLWLEVRSENSGAIAFYKRQGMEVTGKIPNYYVHGDALIMVLSETNWNQMRGSMK
jgi:ribosomal-protein-alanine N-acetyltransferase